MSPAKFTIALLLACIPLPAQTSTGEIDVTVQDTSGAVIPKAAIAITGSDTGNLVRSLTTNDNGLAEAPLLQPGAYDVAVMADGFEKLLRRGIVMQIGEVVNLRLTLTPGSSTIQITVTGETPLLEEKSVTVGQVMQEREMLQLPLNGRNYLDLGRLAAGAVPSQGTRDQTFSAYGNNGLQNAFLLDGARNVNYLRGLDNRARDMLRPPLDAISQFQVQTSNYSAEFGASAGAVVSAITKTGTNQWHGSAYDFLRNDRLDASNYFARGSRPLLVQNQYGGSVGAPIVRNRAWLFGAYEGTHIRSESVGFATLPTLAMRQGNFGSTPIFDPLSTVPNPSGSGFVRTAFSGNVIPPSRFDSVGQKIINLYPAPNLPGVANNFSRNVPQFQSNRNMVIRGDVQLSSKDSVFVRGSVVRSNTDANNPLPPPAQDPANRAINSAGVGSGYTRVFTATMVNEFRFSWTRMTINQDETTPLDEIIPGLLDPRIQHGTPSFNVSGFATIGAQPASVGNSPLIKSSGVWDLSDNSSKSLGRHLLKFGTDLQAIRPSTFSALSGRGSLGFTGVFSQDPQNRSKSGSPVADLILGDANSLSTGTMADAVERGRYAGSYFQDQWTVTPSLTLNLGVRYELFFPFVETKNRMANLILDTSDPLFGRLIDSGDPAKPRSLLALDKNNWAPRIGFAWRLPWANNILLKNTVVRSSYGIFYAQDQGNGVTSRMTNNPPFYGYGGVSVTGDQLNPSTGYVLSSGLLAPRPDPIGASRFVLNPAATTTLVSWNQRYTAPYIQQWNFTIQKQLPWSMVWETTYVGNIGIHIWGLTEGNQPLTNGPGAVNTRRPFARYTVAPIKAFAPWNRSNYEGFSSRLEKRFSSGVSFLASFTHGRALDLQNAALDACDGCGAGDTVQNAYNRNAQRGPSDNNVPLRFAFGGVWDLPFGPSRSFVHSGWTAQVLGRWQVSAIYQVQSGLPFTPRLSFDNANAGTISYPNRVCSGVLPNPSVSQWFDTTCFVAPPSYVFGNSGRNVLTGPGRNNVDFTLHRIFHIPPAESTNLEFRAEAFNLFNHPQFGQPGDTIGNPGVGVISSTSIPNRIVQLALRLAF
jgi:hypothetical protein